jgi:hypothetical protein
VLTPLETRKRRLRAPARPVDLQDGDYLLMGKQVLGSRPSPSRSATCARPSSTAWWCSERPSARPGPARQITRAGSAGTSSTCAARTSCWAGDRRHHISRRRIHVARHAQVRTATARAPGGPGQLERTFLRLRGPHGLASGDLIRLGDELLRFEIG